MFGFVDKTFKSTGSSILKKGKETKKAMHELNINVCEEKYTYTHI